MGKLDSININTCRRCKRLFKNIPGVSICPECNTKEIKKLNEVVEYIENNEMISINELTSACDVKMTQIIQWLREKRLELADDSPIKIPCEKCGAMICSGNFCENCERQRTETINELSHALRQSNPVVCNVNKTAEKKVSNTGKMHFIKKR